MRAAPPDDGGNRGSFGRPEEELRVREPGERRGQPAPDLQYLQFQRDDPRGSRWGAAMVVAAIFAAFTAATYYVSVMWP